MAIAKLRDKLSQEGVAAFLVTDMVNIRYLSSFTGSSAFLLITPHETFFVTDSRYEEQAVYQMPGDYQLKTLKAGGKLSDFIKEVGCASLALEDSVTLSQFNRLKEALEGVDFHIWKGTVEVLRQRKRKEEFDKIKGAVAVAQEAFRKLVGGLVPGAVERDFALELEFLMRKSGAEAAAFDFIVASGDRSYLPHGIASSKIIEEGDMVVVDFGARWQGYHSDISRTFKMGEWQPWERDLYKVILEAQEAAIKCLKPGMKACEIDGAARQVIKDAGYGEFFGHGLGHGVGLEIHEKPSLSPASEDILEEGMVFTLEPGIYLPGKGGVRIEDMVYLDSQGPQVITTLEKEVFL